MGFSGGGSNILKPHTHDSNILQDGGNLDFKNITQSDMSAGSTTYSNGSHLQELVKPAVPAGEVLTFETAATAPSWVVPGVNHDRLEQLAHYEAAGSESSAVLSFTQIDLDDYASLYLSFSGVVVGALDLELLIGSVTTGYRYVYDQSDLGVFTNVASSGQTEIKLCDSAILPVGSWFNGHVWIYPFETNEGTDCYACQYQVHGMDQGNSNGGGFTGSGGFPITSVTVQTSTSNWYEHTRFNLMGLRRS